jgi:hypothetical protein
MARDFLFGGLEHWVRNTVGRGRRNDPTAVAREMVAMLLQGWATVTKSEPVREAEALRGFDQRLKQLEDRLQIKPKVSRKAHAP